MEFSVLLIALEAEFVQELFDVWHVGIVIKMPFPDTGVAHFAKLLQQDMLVRPCRFHPIQMILHSL